MSGFAVFSGNANKELAGQVVKELGVKLGRLKTEKFPDNETYVRIEEDVEGKNVFIIQPTCNPANENLVELFLIADAAKRAKARKIIAVIPYFGYARQDRIVREGEPISAQLFAGLLRKAGVNEVVAMDLHSSAVEKFIRPETHLHALPKIQSYLERKQAKKHLHALPVIADYLKKKGLKNLVVVSPDLGALKNATEQARVLNADIAVIHKKRISGSRVIAEKIEGDIRGKNCVIIDDIISTAGTMSQAIGILKKLGAKNVFVAATHGVLAGKAIARLNKAPVKEVIVTNTIPQKEHRKKLKKLKVLSVAPLLASAISKMA